ncbi:MAG: NAD(P)H-hydrate dehydratase [Hyphomicrobiales bacterium]|nr:NAD(P)H-hydrate dehydratase [Hyphomicrobiales bacterium]
MNILLTADETRAAEAFACRNGISGATMMENAGVSVAGIIRKRFSPRETLVLCGPGNNGGDGFVIARELRRAGWRVRVARDAKRHLPADADAMAQLWQGKNFPLESLEKLPRKPQLVVDALFGTGLTREISDVYARAIKTVASWQVPVVAVDMPSGIDSNSGAVHGVALQADITATFFCGRPGQYLFPGRRFCGEVIVCDIGIPDDALDAMDESCRVFLNRPGVWHKHLPQPRETSHKYRRGHVVVRGGGLAHAGASRLAARAALRCGAGMVTLACSPSALLAHASQETAVIVTSVDANGLESLVSERKVRAMVLGPGNGVGEETREFVLRALRLPTALVLDADALSSFVGCIEKLSDAIAKHNGGVVLTPHSGEFERLFGEIGSDKLSMTRSAAKRIGAVVVHKGADTVVADACGHVVIADNVPYSLSTAGSGDVLAGMLGGLLATGMPAFHAAGCGVWMHGQTAQSFGKGLTAEDLPPRIAGVWHQLER